MIIHTNTPKSKKRKPNAKQRALQASWQDILKKYEPKKKTNTTTKNSVVGKPPAPFRRTTEHTPSLGVIGSGACTKAVSRNYTGTAIIGIATLHKSNAVPVFSQEEAIEISRMRRG
jgi:hypothetical protein